MNLSGKTAIVTGAAVRLGREMALALAREGVHLCVHYGTSKIQAEQTVAEIRELGVKAVTVAADLRDSVAAAKLIFDAAAQLGPVSVLVNSASIFEPGALSTTDEDHWDRHFGINLKTPFFLCREFAQRLPAEECGHIVNMADWRGERPRTGHLTYTLTKAALIALTELLAQELGPRVQVNAIAPGPILPPPGETEAYLERVAKELPLKRSGSAEEIARTLLFLLRSDFITGEIVHVDGGQRL